jgi:flavorubredoxin
MRAREVKPGVHLLGAVDWDRRLFDSLIPLPDGTSYNAYLVQGSDKTALLDTVDPTMVAVLLEQLDRVEHIDYVVCHHAEQDHSGAIPEVMDRYPDARLITTSKGRELVIDHLHVAPERIQTVEHQETLSLGGKTLEFLHTPWVHWPETMVTYLREDRILFSCDFFGSHLTTTDLFVSDPGAVYEAAKRYYAEIMMPFRQIIRKHLDLLGSYALDIVAPSHGPLYGTPSFILEGYADWVSDTPKNEAVVAYVSMHGSTRKLVERLVAELAARDITVRQFDLAVTDIGKLAIALVDAATLVVGTPTVHVGPHPVVVHAANLANAIRPKLRFASVIGSYGWATKAVENVAGLIPNLKVEVLDPVLCKGLPREDDYAAIGRLAEAIRSKHQALGLVGA